MLSEAAGNEYVRHLRSVHFVLVVTCVALIIAVTLKAPSRFQTAREQLKNIDVALEGLSSPPLATSEGKNSETRYLAETIVLKAYNDWIRANSRKTLRKEWTIRYQLEGRVAGVQVNPCQLHQTLTLSTVPHVSNDIRLPITRLTDFITGWNTLSKLDLVPIPYTLHEANATFAFIGHGALEGEPIHLKGHLAVSRVDAGQNPSLRSGGEPVAANSLPCSKQNLEHWVKFITEGPTIVALDTNSLDAWLASIHRDIKMRSNLEVAKVASHLYERLRNQSVANHVMVASSAIYIAPAGSFREAPVLLETVVAIPVDTINMPVNAQQRLLGSHQKKGDFATSFPSVALLTKELEDLKISTLTDVLERQGEAARGDVSVLGVNVSIDLIESSGSVIVAIILFYFALHFAAFTHKFQMIKATSPWIGLYDSILAKGSFLSSTTALPIVTTLCLSQGLLQWTSSKSYELLSLQMSTLIVVIVLSTWIARTTLALWRMQLNEEDKSTPESE